MAHVLHVTGLILARLPFREYDRRFVVYGRETGKLLLIGKGTQRSTSKLAGSLEPLREVRLTIARGRFDRIIGSVVQTDWPAFRTGLRGYAAASFVAHVTDSLTLADNPDPVLYDRLRSCFGALNSTQPLEHGHIVRKYLWRLLDRLGVRPRLDRCATCGAILSAGGVFSAEADGAFCPNCAAGILDAIPLKPDMVASLNALLADVPSSKSLDSAADRATAHVVSAALLAQLGSRLPSEDFWRAMNKEESIQNSELKK